MAKDLDPMTYLTPRDPATIPTRRGRAASAFYPNIVKAFLESGEQAMDVDVERIGRKPDTIRSALIKAIRALDKNDVVRVALISGEVILVRR